MNSTFSFFKAGSLYVTSIGFQHRNNEGHGDWHFIPAVTLAIVTSVTDYDATLLCQNSKNKTVELVWDRQHHSTPHVFFKEVDTVDIE